VLIVASLTVQAQIQTAGDLLVNIETSSLSGLSNGAKISAWPNSGTLGGNFLPAVSGQGAVYQTAVGGAPAVTFAASANSVMTNSVPPPQSILTNNIWSAEVWVLNPTLQTPEDQLSWTDRGSWVGSAEGTCMEIRYCSDAGNAVEHYGGNQNISWSGNPPQAGVWHHVAITRDASGVERLYADGVLRTTKTPLIANLRGGGRFALGGVWDRGASNWQMLFSGSLGNMRVHDGTLSGAQVLNNFEFERATYHSVWTGASGADRAWSDPGNWLSGGVGEAGKTVWIDNGGIALLADSVTLGYLYPTHGGLTISNGATLAVSPLTTVNMADGAGKTFNLTIHDGMLKLPGSSTVNLYGGVNGGSATVAVGGSGATAVLDVDRDTIVANSSGSAGVMTVGDGAGVYNSNGYFYVANNIGATGQLTVDGGVIGFRLADKNFVVNVNGARADVTVNGGLISATGDFQWSGGTSTNVAYGAVYLNGGTLQAKRFYGVTTAGTNLLYLNGGTVRARDSRADFLYNLTAAYVRSGGVTFDVPSGVTVTAAQGLTEDADNTGGGITKTGAGRITLAGVNTVTGDIDVQAGDLFFSNASGLPGGYAGTVTVTNDGAVGYNAVGGAMLLMGRLSAGSSGTLTLFANNAADTVDFSTFPNMKLAFQGFANYTGIFTPYQGQYTFEVEGVTVTNAATLADAGATPGHLSVTGVSGGGMVLTGDNAFTGGAEIDAATVSLGHANALGVQGTPGVPDVELRNGASLRFDAAMDLNAFVTNRLTVASSGILLIGAANAAQSIDLSGHPGIVVGSAELSLDYAGTITPAGNAFRLGGGGMTYAGPNRGLSVSNLADLAGSTAVVIGTPGIVELKAGNTYSGGTVVTNGGVLFIKEDGLGAVPASPDAANLYVNNGVVRAGPAVFALHANRGVTVGSGGMTLHPWGGQSMTIAGDLAGSGKIIETDSGVVTFAGGDNTYNGRVEINAGQNIRIGDGPNFSWASTGGVQDNGTLYLKTDGASTFGDTVSGSGVVRKEGAGTLTLSAQQSYSGITYVQGGTLEVTATNVLPRGTGKGLVEISDGTWLDTAGLDLMVGGLNGPGTVTNSARTAGTLYLGENGVNGSFGGVIDPVLAVVKIGSGRQLLSNTNGAASGVSVQAGTLAMAGSARVTGTVSVANGAILNVVAGETGLVGEFFKLSAAPVPSDYVSLAAVDAFLSGKTPTVTASSTYLGASLDMGSTAASNSKFPTGFNTNADNLFVVRWSGLFYAEVAGSYGFATASDDGSMVFIDGAVAFDNNAMQSYTPADKDNPGFVTLSAGYHEMVIVMYENAGDQGLTVWLTPPGGPQTPLPNSLLFSGLGGTGSTRIGTLSGVAGSRLTFGETGGASLRITEDGDMTFDGAIVSSNANNRLVKEGAGTLTLSSRDSDQQGTLEILSGNLVLTNGASTLGTLVMASGVETRAFGQTGLQMYFYNRSAADNDYSEFQSMAAWEAYLGSTFPGGPSYVANSLTLGTTLDTGATGQYWPAPYKQEGGAEAETYDAYLFGSIYLSESGTYTFATASDDGSMLYIDRVLVVQNGYNQGVTQKSGTITLAAGFHTLAIPYRENTGGNALRVYIGYPGQGLALMPQSILFAGAVLRGLAGEAGSALDLGADSALLLRQDTDTTHAGALVGGAVSVIQKEGAGTLTLTGENPDYAGRYAVNGGAVRVGDGGLTGALGPTAAVSIGPDGTLIFDRDGTVTVDGALSGTGLLQLDGPGEVYVTTTNAFGGIVRVNNGKLTLAVGAAIGPSAAVTNLATVEFETSGSRAQSAAVGVISGSGGLNVTGTGTLVLDRDNDFTGASRVDSGATIKVTRPGQLGGGGDVALDGGTLAILPEVLQGTTELVPALASADWQLNGVAIWSNRYSEEWLQLTPNAASLAGSAFATTPFEAGVPWYASFRYEVGDHPVGAADGIAFVVQNDARGAAALGASGGAIGVNTVTPSLGIFFNLYQTPSIGWIVDGGKADAVTAISGIVLTNGVDVALTYDGVKLTLTVTQDAKIYSATRTIDLSAKFGGSTVYAGFTGGTGGATAQQFVGEFSLYDAVPVNTVFDNVLTVADGLTGALDVQLVNAETSFGFAGVALGAGATLDVSAVAGSKINADYTVAASNVTVAVGTATVNVFENGMGTGVLAVERLTIGSGAKLVVTGAVSVPGGVLTIVVPTPVPRGVTYLADFTGATWVGGEPTLVLVDQNGDPVDESVFLNNGKLYINTILGTLIRLK
jgi:autotransporter-associated beta strand protein